ncbi:MAG: Rid family detoxifying hydrolase, partial [Candidatus Kapaibacteriota bacterium]
PKPIGPYSIYKEKNGMIFISGQIAINPQTNLMVKDSFTAEVKQVLENINVILSELNLKFADVMVVNVYLKDLYNFNEFNTIYGSYFGNSSVINYPPRVTVEVSKLPKDANIEISLIAIRD